jgi:hypothetical protein
MARKVKEYDAIIIGGGIFGLYTAEKLLLKGAKVALLEREKELFNRASRVNQSRVHRGYHYPRSFETADKISKYYNRFCNEFGFAILKPFKQFYAIAKAQSKVTADEYIQFCKGLGIPLNETSKKRFFREDRVEAVFEAEEACFDSFKIKEHFLRKFKDNDRLEIYYNSFPKSQKIIGSRYEIRINGSSTVLSAPVVINATYSGINKVNEVFGFEGQKLKYELCELKHIRMLNGFSEKGVTLMDGPFFSLMPYGGSGVYTLSAVEFTPLDTSYLEPHDINGLVKSNDTRMEELARDYLSDSIDFEYLDSSFEVKPILVSEEEDDGRPTIITIHAKEPTYISIFSGKISTIFDLEGIEENLIL